MIVARRQNAPFVNFGWSPCPPRSVQDIWSDAQHGPSIAIKRRVQWFGLEPVVMRMTTGVWWQGFDLASSHGAQLYFCRMLKMIREDCSLFDSITGGQLPMVGQKDSAFVAKDI